MPQSQNPAQALNSLITEGLSLALSQKRLMIVSSLSSLPTPLHSRHIRARSWSENSVLGKLTKGGLVLQPFMWHMFVWNPLVNHPVNLGLGLGWECRRVTPHYSVLKVNPQPKRTVDAKINWDKNKLMMKDFVSKYLDVHMWNLGKG